MPSHLRGTPDFFQIKRKYTPIREGIKEKTTVTTIPELSPNT
jgi:hypothetical protein